MQVITVTSEKGGTGKTTVTTTVAGLLATLGRKVLVIDSDPQANATLSFGLTPAPGLYDLLVRGRSIDDLVIRPDDERFAPPGMEPRGQLYVLPANRELHAIPQMVEDRDALADALEDVTTFFEVVVIDTAPSPGMMLSLAYSASQGVIVPTQLELLSLLGVQNTVQSATRKGLKLLGIQPNLYRASTDLHGTNLRDLRTLGEVQGWEVWDPIPQMIAWAEASQLQRMIYSLEAGAGAARRHAFALVERVQSALEIEVVHG
jgi:chromosome partitioning protein